MSDPFRRCYKDANGVSRVEDQVNLGGQQGAVTYVYATDYDKLLAAVRWILDNKIALSEGDFYQREGRITPGYGGWYYSPPVPIDIAPTLNWLRTNDA